MRRPLTSRSLVPLAMLLSVLLQPGPYLHSVYDLILDRQGNLLLAGNAELLANRIHSDSFAFILRLLPDGSTDASFGDDGV